LAIIFIAKHARQKTQTKPSCWLINEERSLVSVFQVLFPPAATTKWRMSQNYSGTST